MYYTIYKTTNLVNNKYYYGVHKTEYLDDDYLGSGDNLIIAIKKYGRTSFRKEILCLCESEKEMYELERIFVNRQKISNKNCYNKNIGGNRGPDRTGIKHTEITKKKISRNGSSNGMFGKKQSEEAKLKMNRLGFKHSEKTKINMSLNRRGDKHPLFGKKHSDETKNKIREARLRKV